MRLLALLPALLAAVPARAYTIETTFTAGCHERLTSRAMRAVRREFGLAIPAPSADDEALLDDLPFEPDDDLRDIAAVTLLLGVRDNDLEGHSVLDTSELAEVHNANRAQKKHCLRRKEHDEPDGTELALAECRAYVLTMARHAITTGLDESGAPDASRRALVAVTLPMAGAVRPALPVFWMYMGQALHTLQDSFSHAMRTLDQRRVSVVLNWIDYAGNDLREWRDGPAHMVQLDPCEDVGGFRRDRFEVAGEASTALLRAALVGTLEQRLAAVDVVAGDYLSLHPGCTFDTRWCDAPELAFAENQECGCGSGDPDAAALTVAALIVALSRRRPWSRS